jgi:hypothetical protein
MIVAQTLTDQDVDDPSQVGSLLDQIDGPIAERNRMAWQTASGYARRARVDAAIGRRKQVTGNGPRSRIDECRVTWDARTMSASSELKRGLQSLRTHL